MTDKCGSMKARSLACGWDNTEVELTCLSSPLAEVGTWPDMVPFLIPPSQVFPGFISIECLLLKNSRFGLCFLGIHLRQEFFALCYSSQKLSWVKMPQAVACLEWSWAHSLWSQTTQVESLVSITS